MDLRLNSEMERLLIEVIEKRRPELLKRIPPYRAIDFTEEERDLVIESLADELTATGLKENDEPNDRGRRLDDLIGVLTMLEQ
jgi:hypothetical protein